VTPEESLDRISGGSLTLEEIERLAAWLRILDRWNPKINLTGLGSTEERVRHLVAPVLALRELPAPGPLIDVGSGNGSPGVVWAALRPDLKVILLEPRRKRWAFLREATRCIGRPETVVLCERHDQYGGLPAETVSVRALSLPLSEVAPLLRPSGRLIVFGAEPRPEDGWHSSEQPHHGVHVLRRKDA
jgi:16S rRNA (guanine527-N7)-methyltransferase